MELDSIAEEWVLVQALEALVLTSLVSISARLWRRAKRERDELRAALQEAMTRRPIPVGSGKAFYITGTGGACPVCGVLRPCSSDFTMRGGLGDHILEEHPTTTVASDIRRIRAVGHPTSLS